MKKTTKLPLSFLLIGLIFLVSCDSGFFKKQESFYKKKAGDIETITTPTPPTYSCPLLACDYPAQNGAICTIEGQQEDENGCLTSCGTQVCEKKNECPVVTCSQVELPSYCSVGAFQRDEKGCQVGCGEVSCTCPQAASCPKLTPAQIARGCTKTADKTDNYSCVTCGAISCPDPVPTCAEVQGDFNPLTCPAVPQNEYCVVTKSAEIKVLSNQVRCQTSCAEFKCKTCKDFQTQTVNGKQIVFNFDLNCKSSVDSDGIKKLFQNPVKVGSYDNPACIVGCGEPTYEDPQCVAIKCEYTTPRCTYDFAKITKNKFGCATSCAKEISCQQTCTQVQNGFDPSKCPVPHTDEKGGKYIYVESTADVDLFKPSYDNPRCQVACKPLAYTPPREICPDFDSDSCDKERVENGYQYTYKNPQTKPIYKLINGGEQCQIACRELDQKALPVLCADVQKSQKPPFKLSSCAIERTEANGGKWTYTGEDAPSQIINGKETCQIGCKPLKYTAPPAPPTVACEKIIGEDDEKTSAWVDGDYVLRALPYTIVDKATFKPQQVGSKSYLSWEDNYYGNKVVGVNTPVDSNSGRVVPEQISHKSGVLSAESEVLILDFNKTVDAKGMELGLAGMWHDSDKCWVSNQVGTVSHVEQGKAYFYDQDGKYVGEQLLTQGTGIHRDAKNNSDNGTHKLSVTINIDAKIRYVVFVALPYANGQTCSKDSTDYYLQYVSYYGQCKQDELTNSCDGQGGKLICHNPPGNQCGKKTMCKKNPQGHLGHGDTLGACK